MDDQKRLHFQFLKFRVQNFLPVIIQFLSSLEQRLEIHENTCSLFGFLCESLDSLESLDCTEIEVAAANLVAEYKDALDQTLGVKLVQIVAFFTHFPEDDKIGREHFLHNKLSR